MDFVDTMRGLVRRWYIVLPGILLAALLAVGAWYTVPATYERSSTQLLIPGADSMPEGANPYLFLGGLAPAADVLVRAVGSENVVNEVVAEHPGVQIEVSRDTTTAGPVIIIKATANSDTDAKQVLELLIQRTATVLEDLQNAEGIAAKSRVTVMPLTIDDRSSLNLRYPLIAVAAASLAAMVLTLLLAALVDGYSLQRKQRAGFSEQHSGKLRSSAPTDNPAEQDESALLGVRAEASELAPGLDQSSDARESDTIESPLRSAR